MKERRERKGTKRESEEGKTGKGRVEKEEGTKRESEEGKTGKGKIGNEEGDE